MPIAFGLIGWRLAGWPGIIAGLPLGGVAAVAAWGAFIVVSTKRRLRRRLDAAHALATHQLLAIVADPTSPDIGFAVGALAARGIDAAPSVSSLLDLVTSNEPNRRGLGMSLLMAFHPQIWSKLPAGSSNQDPPDVWRARIAAIIDGGEKHTGPNELSSMESSKGVNPYCLFHKFQAAILGSGLG